MKHLKYWVVSECDGERMDNIRFLPWAHFQSIKVSSFSILGIILWRVFVNWGHMKIVGRFRGTAERRNKFSFKGENQDLKSAY